MLPILTVPECPTANTWVSAGIKVENIYQNVFKHRHIDRWSKAMRERDEGGKGKRQSGKGKGPASERGIGRPLVEQHQQQQGHRSGSGPFAQCTLFLSSPDYPSQQSSSLQHYQHICAPCKKLISHLSLKTVFNFKIMAKRHQLCVLVCCTTKRRRLYRIVLLKKAIDLTNREMETKKHWARKKERHKQDGRLQAVQLPTSTVATAQPDTVILLRRHFWKL